MNNKDNKALYIGGGVVLGMLIVLTFSPVMRFGSMMSWNYGSMGSSRTASISSIDQHFIEQMIPHHQGAIDMSNLALQRAQHPEIKALAEAIIQSQAKEIQDMRTWYSAWFGKSVPADGSALIGGMMSGGGMHMGGREDLSALENAADFDKEFIEQMIPHHQMALMMARMLESGTSRPEMLQLARNITASQSKEIRDMQDWYAKWYR